VVRWVRHAAESEGAWLRVLPAAPHAVLGPCWHGPEDTGERPAEHRSDGIVALVGASGRLTVADLRLGQALETIRLTAAALGLDLQVLAAPSASTAAETGPQVAPGTESLAVIRVRRQPS
jgi:hypothetical protein